MTELIRKQYTSEIKDIDQDAKALTMVISTEDKDRDGDIIEAAGWDFGAYRDNPVVLFAHKRDQPAVGKITDLHVEAGKTLGRIQFAPTPFAQELWQLYSGGYMRASSVGFVPKESEPLRDSNGTMPLGGRRFKKQELLELSLVPVPANAGAVSVLRSKGIEVEDGPEPVEAAEGIIENAPGLDVEQALAEMREIAASVKAYLDAKDATPEPAEFTAGGIVDELDYLKEMLSEHTLPSEAIPLAREVAKLLSRDAGDETARDNTSTAIPALPTDEQIAAAVDRAMKRYLGGSNE